MALNTFIMDVLSDKESAEKSFEKWRDETLAERKRLNSKEQHYIQNHYQPRIDYEKNATVFFEENKKRRAEYMKKKTSDSLHIWLSNYSKMPDNTVSKIYTAFT